MASKTKTKYGFRGTVSREKCIIQDLGKVLQDLTKDNKLVSYFSYHMEKCFFLYVPSSSPMQTSCTIVQFICGLPDKHISIRTQPQNQNSIIFSIRIHGCRGKFQIRILQNDSDPPNCKWSKIVRFFSFLCSEISVQKCSIVFRRPKPNSGNAKL